MIVSTKFAKLRVRSHSGQGTREPEMLRNCDPRDLSVEQHRVLVIGGKSPSTAKVSELLKAMGYRCLSASSSSALTMLERETFQAVLLYHEQASMPADEVILKIRQIDSWLLHGLMVIGSSAIDPKIAKLVQRHHLVCLSPDDLTPEQLWATLQEVTQRRRDLGPRSAYVPSARLIFDSMNSPSLKDVRSLGTPFRQFLYEHGNVTIDILLEASAGSSRWLLRGQVLCTPAEDAPRADLPVLLLSGTKTLARTTTDRFGEFNLEFDAVANSALEIRLQERLWVAIPLEGMRKEGKFPL